MSPPAVSVLIVNFRVYDELDRALTSLEGALGPDDEVVVFDQVSETARLRDIAARHTRVVPLGCAENVGFAAGVNRAAARARHDYLLLLNPDTLVEGPIPAVLAEWLAHHPETGLVAPRIVNEDGSVQASARRFPGPSAAIAGRSTWLSRRFPRNWLTRRNLLAREADAPAIVDWLAGSCLMIRRDLFERLGGLDESFFLYWEDADFARRAKSLGYTCAYLPSVTVRHFGGRSAALDPGPSIRAFHASAYRMYWKHAGPLGRLAAPAAWLALRLRGEIRARGAVRRLRASRRG